MILPASNSPVQRCNAMQCNARYTKKKGSRLHSYAMLCCSAPLCRVLLAPLKWGVGVPASDHDHDVKSKNQALARLIRSSLPRSVGSAILICLYPLSRCCCSNAIRPPPSHNRFLRICNHEFEAAVPGLALLEEFSILPYTVSSVPSNDVLITP